MGKYPVSLLIGAARSGALFCDVVVVNGFLLFASHNCFLLILILASRDGSYLYSTFKRKTSEERFDNGNGKISKSLLLHFCYRCMFVFVINGLFADVVDQGLLFASYNSFLLVSLYSSFSKMEYSSWGQEI